jgi:hypothetical protein
MIALLTIRYKNVPVHPDSIRMPLILIVTFLIVAIGLVVIPIWQEFEVTALGLAICVVGLGFYYLFVHPTRLPKTLVKANGICLFNTSYLIYI